LAAGGVTTGLAIKRAHSSAPPAGVRVVAGASLAAGHREILFRNTIPDKTFGKVAVASAAHPNGTRELSNLSCDRVYFAGGRGLCLTAAGAFASHYVAKIFDASFDVRHELAIPGIPSRARVSADGKLGAITTFVYGDSYAAGQFSTRTQILSMA